MTIYGKRKEMVSTKKDNIWWKREVRRAVEKGFQKGDVEDEERDREKEREESGNASAFFFVSYYHLNSQTSSLGYLVSPSLNGVG